MRRLVIPLLLVALAAGCGGGKHDDNSGLRLSGVPSSASCDAKGISTSDARPGRCVAGSTKIAVANRGGTLQMQAFSVQVTGLRTAGRLGHRAATNFTPEGRFVIATLKVTNTTGKAEQFDLSSNLAYLLVDGTQYQEVPDAEGELAGSFAPKGAPIKAGAAGTGTVVFDPPQQAAEQVREEGSYVLFLNPEDTGNGLPRLGFRALGFIRLWK